MRYIKTYNIFESTELVDRNDIEDILLPLKDIGVEYELDGTAWSKEALFGKDFISFEIKKFKAKTRQTIPDYMDIDKGEVYMASFDTKRNTYLNVYQDGARFNTDGFVSYSVHASHLDIIGYKWKDLRDEVLHLVSFMLDEGYFFFYKNSIKVSEVINPNGKGLTWMEEDVLKKTAGNEIEILESLDPETDIAELKITFTKKLS